MRALLLLMAAGSHALSPSTRVLVVTTGVLVRRLQADPTLEGVPAIGDTMLYCTSLHTRHAHLNARLYYSELLETLSNPSGEPFIETGPSAAASS